MQLNKNHQQDILLFFFFHAKSSESSLQLDQTHFQHCCSSRSWVWLALRAPVRKAGPLVS